MRKEVIITIEDNGNPLKFKIKQMPAVKQQKFLIKLLLLVAKSGAAGAIDIPDEVKIEELSTKDLKGMKVMDVLSKLGSVDYDSVEPLINELLGCCSRITDGGSEMICTPATIDGYVDNVKTLFKLEWEAAKLNFDFFQGAASSQVSAPKAEADIVISKPIKM